MRERQHPTLAEHDVEVKLLRQLLILPHREVVQPRTLGVEVVRPHDGGVAPGIATADPARFEHGHIRDAMVLR